jgi:hypothetical protein
VVVDYGEASVSAVTEALAGWGFVRVEKGGATSTPRPAAVAERGGGAQRSDSPVGAGAIQQAARSVVGGMGVYMCV